MTAPTTPIIINPRRPKGATGPVRIVLRWRDENYGRLSGTLAFRATVEADLSDAMTARLHRVYGRSGFEYDCTRASFIAKAPGSTTPLKLARDLEDAGFVCLHMCCVPDALRAVPSLDALHQLRAEYVDICADIEEATLMGAVETLTDDQLRAAAAGYTDASLPEAGNRIINSALTLAVLADLL